MGRVNNTIQTVNSAVRTLLFALLLAGAGFAGWKGYSLYNEPQKKLEEKQVELDSVREKLSKSEQNLAASVKELAEMATQLQAKTKQIDRLETSMRLLKLSHRIARLHVVDQQENPDTGQTLTTVEFFEVNDDGAPVDDRRREFKIEGDRIYVECLVAKFEDKYVEKADLDRSTAICLFQRIFGEYQQPQEGFELDEIGSSPLSYARGGMISDFEKNIWADFWNIANDRQKAAKLGIRAAHADAPSTRVRKGKTYELELRATGEFTLKPVADAAAGSSPDRNAP